ncbi:MutT/nudix family protein [Candidatus Zixiibacteriota bacterium]|nr:MutT/nudix family protein [candidate division Zixibacteria bacterium]
MNQPRIRPIAIAIIHHNNKILVARSRDEVKNETFYRPLGGAIEFGETGRECIIRELKEEIGAEITDLNYINMIENIFVYNGEPGHELVMVFEGRLTDSRFYASDNISFSQDEGWDAIEWISIDDFRNWKKILYPDRLVELIDNFKA